MHDCWQSIVSHFNCVKDKGYLASRLAASYLSPAWLTLRPPDKCYHALESPMMITPDLITTDNIIMTMMSHINITSAVWYNSDLTRRHRTVYQLHHGVTAWKKHREASFLLKSQKICFEKKPGEIFHNHPILLTFCEPIKNFEDQNLDNINIVYNFTRQKEGNFKFELGSSFVHNLYRMVSSTYSLLSQLSTCNFQGVHGYQASHRSSGISQSFGSQGGKS